MRQNVIRHANVVVHHLTFCEPVSGIQNLVQIRKRDLPAIDSQVMLVLHHSRLLFLRDFRAFLASLGESNSYGLLSALDSLSTLSRFQLSSLLFVCSRADTLLSLSAVLSRHTSSSTNP